MRVSNQHHGGARARLQPTVICLFLAAGEQAENAPPGTHSECRIHCFLRGGKVRAQPSAKLVFRSLHRVLEACASGDGCRMPQPRTGCNGVYSNSCKQMRCYEVGRPGSVTLPRLRPRRGLLAFEKKSRERGLGQRLARRRLEADPNDISRPGASSWAPWEMSTADFRDRHRGPPTDACGTVQG
jgi:hypothetical protein